MPFPSGARNPPPASLAGGSRRSVHALCAPSWPCLETRGKAAVSWGARSWLICTHRRCRLTIADGTGEVLVLLSGRGERQIREDLARIVRRGGLWGGMDGNRSAAHVDGVIGEVLAGIASESGRVNPYPFYERLRQLGPYVTASDGSVIVNGYRAVSAFLKDHRLGKAPERRRTARG